MTEKREPINELLEKLEILLKRQEDFAKEIEILRMEISKLNREDANASQKKESFLPQPDPVQFEAKKPSIFPSFPLPARPTPDGIFPQPRKKSRSKSEIEKFVGENLINKIGIAITIIGVAIGAKYSIDHDLISPLTRIILGYLMGIGLLGFGMKLKEKYENFSAVLVSGAIAILYFITFLAYDLYQLIPQFMAFGLMVVFTGFAVVAALKYNKQVIAHIGLVGAYAVPFLLSDGSGKVAVLFSYMTIINIGILILSFTKYWKQLYYAAFGLTWIIYGTWYVTSYDHLLHFSLSWIFLTVFFAIFYGTFLAYKLGRKEKYERSDIVLLLANSFIFFGFGYALLEGHESGIHLLGLFAIGNAFIHFAISAFIFRQKLADKSLYYLVAGLVLVFLTVAVPIQLDGNWVTILWAGEAALLFWIGRTKNVAVYEKIAYSLMLLAFFSILQDWAMGYNIYSGADEITPLVNVNFLSSLLFVAAFAFINILHRNESYPSALQSTGWTLKLISYALPSILLLSVFNSFRMEIEMYWDQLYAKSELTIGEYGEYHSNYDLLRFQSIWIINYCLLFVSVLSFLNHKKIQNTKLGAAAFALNVLAILLFLTTSLYELSELRQSYLGRESEAFYEIGESNLWIRYVCFGFVALAIYSCHQFTLQEYVKRNWNVVQDLLLHISLVWILSSELLHWMDLAGSSQTYKLGLSILWGAYSLLLISLGIWKKKAYLRIGGIALFGITLAKLFFYDISNLDTIAKTVVFVSLGILLLIISFLYNKYKHIISDDSNG